MTQPFWFISGEAETQRVIWQPKATQPSGYVMRSGRGSCIMSFKNVLCTPAFIAALFTTAKRQKQPKYLLMVEWISKSGLSVQWNIILP